MEIKNLLAIFAIIAVIVAGVNFSITLMKYSELSNLLTGLASEPGYVNLTVSTQVAINFTTDTIDWGSGVINTGENNASLLTRGTNTEVLRGNWSEEGVEGLVLENIGNNNVSLNFSSGTDAEGLFGGTEKAYQWNVSEIESGACTSTGPALDEWHDVSTSSTEFCNPFPFDDSKDELWVNIKLVVPYDGNTGELSDTITAEAYAV